MIANIWQHQEGAGADLVVLHGWGLNSAIWRPLLSYLSPHYRVHCIDLPGYGESPWPTDKPVSLASYVDFLVPILPERCHLLGWSLGGLIATAIALSAPNRVQSLIQVCSSPRFVEDTTSEPTWPGMSAKVLQLFQRNLSADFEQTVSRFLAIQAMGSPSARADTKQIKELVFTKPLPDLMALKGGLDLLANTDLRALMPQLQMPLLSIYGEHDTLVPVATAAHVKALMAGKMATQHMLPHTSHAPFMTAPEAFTKQLLQFTNAD